MAKDPAFLFYPNDFTTGTMFFTDEQVGKYLRLLCAQHQHGHLTEKQMLHICKIYDEDIFAKFKKDDLGLFFNEKLEEETNKRKNFTESRRNNRVKTKTSDVTSDATYVNHMFSHMIAHMENENENENINELVLLKDENFKKNWLLWLEYKKKEYKFTYKSPLTEKAALKELFKLADGVPQDATEIINQSISHGWKGFFKLKTNETRTSTNSKQSGVSQLLAKAKSDYKIFSGGC